MYVLVRNKMKLLLIIYLCVLLYLKNTTFAMKNEAKAPNFVFILTDDQDLLLNGLLPMKNMLKLIANQGKTYTNAFVNSPICCPSRSTILTGRYPHNTGVVNNSLSGNCSSLFWQKNIEPHSIAAHLKGANYETFYAGKYLNEYGNKKVGGPKHVPPGFDKWMGLVGNSKYYDYTLSINGKARKYFQKYLTDVLSDFVDDFFTKRGVNSKPFFVMVAPPAPHAPFTPAFRHKNNFPDEKVLKTPNFNFSSKEKHWLVQMGPKFLPQNISFLDDIHKNRLRSLLAVDEMIIRIVNRLKMLGEFENTYFIFTSDNGFHIGQFAQPWDKRQPYDTDIRVPFFIKGPQIPKHSLSDKPISAIDIAPTILDLASIQIPDFMDGQTFKNDLFSNSTGEINKNEIKEKEKFILVEYWGESQPKTVDTQCPWSYDPNLAECDMQNWCKCQDSKNNTYSCVLHLKPTEKYVKYCQFYDNKNWVEAYDLKQDPYELNNIYSKMDKQQIVFYNKQLRNMKSCFGMQCRIF